MGVAEVEQAKTDIHHFQTNSRTEGRIESKSIPSSPLQKFGKGWAGWERGGVALHEKAITSGTTFLFFVQQRASVDIYHCKLDVCMGTTKSFFLENGKNSIVKF